MDLQCVQAPALARNGGMMSPSLATIHGKPGRDTPHHKECIQQGGTKAGWDRPHALCKGYSTEFALYAWHRAASVCSLTYARVDIRHSFLVLPWGEGTPSA